MGVKISRATISTIQNRVNSQFNQSDRVYYEELPFGNDISFPSSQNSLDFFVRKFMPSLENNFSTYQDSKWLFQDVNDSSIIEENLSFSSSQDIADWYNNNLQNNGSVFTQQTIARMYDEVDNNILPISKMYGMNRFFSGLKGRGNYKSGPSTAREINNSWSSINSYLKQMFDTIEPTLAFVVQESDFNNQQALDTIWLSSNHLKYYILPTLNSTISHTSSTYRRMNNQNWEGLGSFSVTLGQNYRLRKPHYSFITQNTGSSALQIIDFSFRDAQRRAKENLLGDTASGVIFYQVYDPTQAEGDKKFAIYIKPLGIDVVYLNWFDTNLYDLETVMINTEHQRVNYKKANNDIFLNDSGSSMIGVNKSAWTESSSSRIRVLSSQWKNQGDVVFFRLRDKQNNKVSKLSNSFIYWEDSVGISPGKWMVY